MWIIMSRAATIISAIFLALPATALAQQRPGIRPIKEQQPARNTFGIQGAMLIPVGEFDSYIGNGYGLTLDYVRDLDPSGAVQLRFEGGFLRYGHERERACLVNCRINVDITTSNDIAVFGVGPQFRVPRGPIRPYVTGTVGLAYFFTHSSLEGTFDNEDFADTKNFDDKVFSWTAGGGIQVPVRQGPRPISIDVGVRYHGNGNTSYRRKGSITDNPDGSVTINPISSEANFLSARLGVAFSF
jgi:opacity protein-like surface antigen